MNPTVLGVVGPGFLNQVPTSRWGHPSFEPGFGGVYMYIYIYIYILQYCDDKEDEEKHYVLFRPLYQPRLSRCSTLISDCRTLQKQRRYSSRSTSLAAQDTCHVL